MTYEKLVEFVSKNLKKTAAKKITNHIAVEFDIYGEGEGAFYVEVKEGVITAAPYEYYDRDAKVFVTSDELVKIVKGEKTAEDLLNAVKETMPKKKDVLKSYLVESKTLEVYSTKDSQKGKLAITEYEVLQTNGKYSLLKINIKTGRRNQIRVQLSDIGNPIVGDKKYHSKSNPLKRLGLHANLVEYQEKGKVYKFETKYPKEFSKLFKNV